MKKLICLPLILLSQILNAQTISGPIGSYNTTLILTIPGPIVLPYPWTGPVGIYTFTAPSPVTVTKTDNSITFTWGSLPPPPPTPTPIPITAHLYALAVFDNTNNTANDAQKLLNQVNLSLITDLKSLNCDFAFCDKSSTDFSTWIPSGPFPALVVISVNTGTNAGDQVETIPLPIDGAPGVISEIKKLRTSGKSKVNK